MYSAIIRRFHVAAAGISYPVYLLPFHVQGAKFPITVYLTKVENTRVGLVAY